MNIPKTIGFPRMMKEASEMRVFLPEFIQFLAGQGVTVFVEDGYGSRSGYTFDDFCQGNEKVRICSREQAFQQDMVIVLRSPTPEEFGFLRPGAILFSMLHFPTRPQRVERLKKHGINAISMDSVTNDLNIRLIENMHAVAWNGLEAAFNALERHWSGLARPEPFRVLILGTGMVGKYAIDAATKLGNTERNNAHIQAGGPGAIALSIGRNMSGNPVTMEALFKQVDILVDATQRRDASKPVVPNDWLAWLPEHAVITDLAVDPYTLDGNPPVVRGIEGIPQGSLDKYTFNPADPEWDDTIPTSIPSQNRRTVVSCYSWPGIHPEACMQHYSRQIQPLMHAFLQVGYDGLSSDGEYFERAFYRGTLKAWLKSGYYRPAAR